jgi:N-acetylmuramoyl-L-alanine amidase
MKIRNHRLFNDDDEPVPFEATPNMGGPLDPRFLIMHYTAGASVESSVRWMQRPDAQASAHVVIGRDGRIVQMVPFNRVAWHAGRSSWAGLNGLNQYSLGIEMDNWGPLKERAPGQWFSWMGSPVPADQVIVARHRHGGPEGGWHTFTPAQIDAALQVGVVLREKYGFQDVLGHEDISPGRKTDPGPAFPLGSVASRIMGRSEEGEERHESTVHLNVRSGPGVEHPTVPGSPIPPGTPVAVLGESGLWREVEVIGAVGGIHDIQGWVHGRYLRRADR